jgi:UDP-N-acetylglucosamine 2-epimerase (non-hydrolysing)
MAKFKVMVVFGTRPEAIKMAPVVLELAKYPELVETVVAVTAQHRQMLDQVLNLFDIKPDHDLDIMSQGQTLFDVTGRTLRGLNEVLTGEKPDLVLVHGDTTTTFVGALASFYHQIPVGHVEAGLRTNNKYSPFPEEMNRKLTGALTDYHFAPTSVAKENLLREATVPENIFVTGNTVIDALKNTVTEDYVFADETISKLVAGGKKIILLTTHRRENLGEPMRQVYRALAAILAEFKDEVEIVFPVHKNPLVRQIAEAEFSALAGIHLIEPLDYQPFANLMNKVYLVLTDSGGVQEEAPALGKPVLVLRDTTERPEAVLAGTVKLIGVSKDAVYRETKMLLTNNESYAQMANAVNPYGDGNAAERIVKWILHKHGLGFSCPLEFLGNKNH